MPIRISARRVTVLLTIATVVIVGIGAIEAIGRVQTGQTFRGLAYRFDLDSDTSLPTWFAGFGLALASLLALLLSVTERDRRRGWRALAGVVLFMSIDEIATFHEWSGDALKTHSHGFLYYGWVIIGFGAVVVVGLALLPFVLRLDPRTRRAVFLAGVIYLSGALLLESYNGKTDDQQGTDNMKYVVGTIIEESFEFAGVIVLVDGLAVRLAESGAAFDATITR